MIYLGSLNTLKITSIDNTGAYLEGGDHDEVFLPERDLPEDAREGMSIEVFVYPDPQGGLIATTTVPFGMVGEFAFLEVVGVEPFGAFLDWGLEKDLFLPASEQTRRLEVGDDVIVFVHLDIKNKVVASMKLERFIDSKPGSYVEGQEVHLLIAAKTDLGVKAIVEDRHWGMIYENEIYQPLVYGQRLQGYIKKMRPDGKIDLSLQDPQKVGHHAADDVAPKIVDLLKANGGFYAITDKTPAETIYNLFGVSKKRYKIALGGLYKKRVIRVEDDGIHLVTE